MFDPNKFKRDMKNWVRENPAGTIHDFQDFCEEQIPPQQYSAHRWIVDQSVDWYRYVLSTRERQMMADDMDDDCP